MSEGHMIKSASLACLLSLLGVVMAGCQGCSTPAAPSQAKATSPAAANATSPVVEVVGNQALVDLGPVNAGSRHEVVFVVNNPSDQPLVLRTVRGDCECVSAKDAPSSIAAGSSARIAVIYVAPKPAIEYESRLLIATDSATRRVISLRVKSSPPKR